MSVNTFKREYLCNQRADCNQTLFEASLGEGQVALSFGPDRVRTLFSMATYSFHSVIMGKFCDHSSAFMFDRIFVILAGNKDNYKITDDFKTRPNPTSPLTAELAALERLEKSQ